MMQKLIYRILFFIFLIVFLTHSARSQEASENIIYSFSQTWLKYDKYYEAYLPLKDNDIKKSKSVHQKIQLEKYRNYNLSFFAEKGLSLFVNSQLIYKKISGEEENVLIPLSSIKVEDDQEVIFTFYHPKGDLPIYTASITHKAPVTDNINQTEENYLLLRKADEHSGYLLLFILIVTLFVTFKQIYPKEYIRYYSIRIQENSDHLLPSSFSIPSLWMAVMNALSISLLIHLLKLNEVIFNSSPSLFKGTLYVLLFYMVFYIGKYFYLLTIAWLFNYSKVVSHQFAEYIRLFEIFSLLSSTCIFAIESSGLVKINISPELLYFSLILVLIFCVIKVIFLFFRLISHRNLYLFSYICAAEILPLIIAVKILLF